ncbi:MULTISPECIES: HD domain-containing protein [Citrobacter]|uniref:hypothetical protein n=1 Tax=Citrobacter TaxID=544 RepID=UPI0010C94A93|nr:MULTISPECIES: hypothetical protein [Citrobacter]MDL4458312.1 hypothetical protein [Citrobacter youngae]TKU92831.1 hypothetical protein FDX00_11585 [Citrobacter sp. wls617]HEF0078820.1 hypothetical protein [Citrobacter youngae]
MSDTLAGTGDEQLARILRHCIDSYRLKLHGTHGLSHWTRVLLTGRRLCDALHINHHLVDLFALLHDSQRQDEGRDSDHGPRAEIFIRELVRKGLLQLPTDELDLLSMACSLHTKGLTDGPIIAQVCWDADRLDLGRVGISPQPAKLCTSAAREPILFRWAVDRGTSKAKEELPWACQVVLERDSMAPGTNVGSGPFEL